MAFERRWSSDPLLSTRRISDLRVHQDPECPSINDMPASSLATTSHTVPNIWNGQNMLHAGWTWKRCRGNMTILRNKSVATVTGPWPRKRGKSGGWKEMGGGTCVVSDGVLRCVVPSILQGKACNGNGLARTCHPVFSLSLSFPLPSFSSYSFPSSFLFSSDRACSCRFVRV